MAYITGVGICENVPRILSENTVATIDSQSGPLPKLFQWLQQAGNIEIQEMYHTLNCGIGMVLVVNAVPILEYFHINLIRKTNDK